MTIKNWLIWIFIKLTCKIGWHLWYVVKGGDGEILRICDCCGKIRKREKI